MSEINYYNKMKSINMNFVIIHFSNWLLPPSAQSPELLHRLRLQSSCMLHQAGTTIIPTDSPRLVYIIHRSMLLCLRHRRFVWFRSTTTTHSRLHLDVMMDAAVTNYRLASARFLRLDLVLLTRTNIKHHAAPNPTALQYRSSYLPALC